MNCHTSHCTCLIIHFKRSFWLFVSSSSKLVFSLPLLPMTLSISTHLQTLLDHYDQCLASRWVSATKWWIKQLYKLLFYGRRTNNDTAGLLIYNASIKDKYVNKQRRLQRIWYHGLNFLKKYLMVHGAFWDKMKFIFLSFCEIYSQKYISIIFMHFCKTILTAG